MFELNPIYKRCTRHGNNIKQIKVEKLKKSVFSNFLHSYKPIIENMKLYTTLILTSLVHFFPNCVNVCPNFTICCGCVCLFSFCFLMYLFIRSFSIEKFIYQNIRVCPLFIGSSSFSHQSDFSFVPCYNCIMHVSGSKPLLLEPQDLPDKIKFIDIKL